MYHIPNDMRAKRTAEALSEALLELGGRKAFLDIGVSELCKKAGVGRSSFYRLFDNVYDIIAYRSDAIMEKALDRLERERPRDRKEAILGFIDAWLSEKRLLALLSESSSYSILSQSHERYFPRIKKALFPGHEPDGVGGDFLLAIFSSLVPAGLRAYEKHPELNSGQILEQINKSLLLLESFLGGLN